MAIAAFAVGFLSVWTGLRGFNLLVFYQIGTTATKYKKDIKAKLDLKKRADTDAQAKLAATADAAAGNMYLKAVENFDKNIDEIDDDDSDKMD